MRPNIEYVRPLWPMALAIWSMGFASLAIAKEVTEIELPNEHGFIRLQDVSIIEKEGRTAINGSAFKFRDKFMPWGSHLHIDLVDLAANDEGEEKEIVIERVIYRFRRNDFDDGGRFERFFKYVDLSNPAIDKVVVKTFTQKHTETCGEPEKENDDP